MRPNVHEATIHKHPPSTGVTSTMSGQHSSPELTETMTDDHPEHHHRPRPVKTQKPVEATIHQPPHTGVTSMMSGQHSLPDSTETMTDDHPEHHHQPVALNLNINTQPQPVVINQVDQTNIHQSSHTGATSMISGQHSLPDSTETMTDNHSEHQPRPVMTQKPGPISETPLMSTSEADTEEHIMPPVITEDHAMMPGKELTNAIESNEVMIEEMSEHDEMISIHDFKEVLHEIVKDAVDKIVMKKAGIVGKLKTAKQNLIGHNGEVSGRCNLKSAHFSRYEVSSHCVSRILGADNKGKRRSNPRWASSSPWPSEGGCWIWTPKANLRNPSHVE